MMNGFNLYFHNLKQFLRWGHSAPPVRGVSGGGHPKLWSIFWVAMSHIKRKPLKNATEANIMSLKIVLDF